MLRIARLAACGAALLTVWILLFTVSPPGQVRHLITLGPVILLLAFGLYALVLLIHGVVVFRTVPEEAELLQRDIVRAKRALSAKGLCL